MVLIVFSYSDIICVCHLSQRCFRLEGCFSLAEVNQLGIGNSTLQRLLSLAEVNHLGGGVAA